MVPAGALLLGLTGVGTAGAGQPAPGDTLAQVEVVVGIHLRGREYEGLRGARVVVLRAPEVGPPGDVESRRVADISPGSPACGGAAGQRTCFITTTAHPGRATIMVELVPAAPIGDSFPEVYPRPVSQETLTISGGGADTVRFDWRAPTLPEVWTELLGREHLGFGLPLAALFAAATVLLMRGPLRHGGRRVVVGGVLLAILVPWLTGAAVKLWLQAHGKATLPWGMFLNLRSLPQLVFLGALFGAPLIWTAWLAARVLRRPADPVARRRRECAALGAITATVGAVTLSSVALFWVFEPMAFMIAPSFWLAWLPVAVAGTALGWLIGGLPRRGTDAPT